MWRDLLNLALGNRDNHGRNTAILKDTDGTMRLAPLFDVGPTFLDALIIAQRAPEIERLAHSLADQPRSKASRDAPGSP